MKVEIDENGMLIIESEIALESYAIQKWYEENRDRLPPSILFIHKAKRVIEHTKA